MHYLLGQAGFGIDEPKHYGTLTYDDENTYGEELVVSEIGDYRRFYDKLYEAIVNVRNPL